LSFTKLASISFSRCSFSFSISSCDRFNIFTFSIKSSKFLGAKKEKSENSPTFCPTPKLLLET